MSHELPNLPEIVVIGAGMTGLSAASVLHQAGLHVCLIEAQARVGGRVCSENDRGETIELGAQTFNRDMKTLVWAARRHGLHSVPLHNLGRTQFDGIEPAQAEAAIDQLETLLDKPDWDDQNFQSLAQNPNTSLADAVDSLSPDELARALMDSYVQELWGRPMEQIQFAHALEVHERFDSNRDDWELQLAEGLGALAERIGNALGNRLKLATPVQQIELQGNDVLIKTTEGMIRADAAIVAVPPTIAKRLMPDEHWSQTALSAFEDGDLIKLVARYDDTFWRREGYSGESVSVNLPGFATADGTLAGGGIPTLVLFIGGEQARQLHALSKQQRWQKIRVKLIELFGEQAGNPYAWTERSWVDDPWVGGAYNAHVPPGAMLEPGAVLRQFKGRITFACAEIATRFPGYVEGAMQEGQNAAERVLSGFRLSSRLDRAPATGLWSKLKARFQPRS